MKKETLLPRFTGSDREIKCFAQGHTIYDVDNEKAGNSGLTSRVQGAVCIATLSPLGRFPQRANDIPVWVADKELSTVTRISKKVFKLEQLILTDQRVKLWIHFRGYKKYTDRHLFISPLQD